MVKNQPTMQKTWVQYQGWKDPLEKGMATHSSILAWRITWTEEPGRLQSMVSQKVGHNSDTHSLVSGLPITYSWEGSTDFKHVLISLKFDLSLQRTPVNNDCAHILSSPLHFLPVLDQLLLFLVLLFISVALNSILSLYLLFHPLATVSHNP